MTVRRRRSPRPDHGPAALPADVLADLPTDRSAGVGPPPRHLPTPRSMLRHAGPHVLEGSIAPFVLFALTIRLASLTTALLVALMFSFAAMARRVLSGRRVSGILILSTLTLTARTVFAVVSGNMNLYFVPPLVTTMALALAFACSVPLGRPLTWRLANDLWPMPPHALSDLHVGAAFRRLCWLWTGVNVSKAALNIWLLTTLPVASYAVAKGIVSFALMGAGLTVSYMWIRRALRSLPEPAMSMTGPMIGVTPQFSVR